MPVQIKPHSITVRTVAQTAGSDSVLENPVADSPSAPIACLCQPLKPKEAFERFGVVLRDAWTVTLEIADAASLSPQALIAFGSNTYAIQGDVEVHQNGDAADCAIAYMARLQYPEAL
ncbi:MAG: hypothetical protein P4L46_17515 [Fimbriimonas sp.]|nr:hypothetical protein [Fimbriimonas sp.]